MTIPPHRSAGATGHTTDHNDISDVLTLSLSGPPFASASGYSTVAESLINDCEGTEGGGTVTGGAPVSGAWVGVNTGNINVNTTAGNHTEGTKSVNIATFKTGFNVNPSLTTKAYINLASDQATGTHHAVAFDLKWVRSNTMGMMRLSDSIELFVSSAVDVGGTVATARMPNLADGAAMTTMYVPVGPLTKVRCIGIRSIATSDTPSSQCGIYIDNIRWAAQTELEVALGDRGAAIVPSDYTPGITQRTLSLASTERLIDLRSTGTRRYVSDFQVTEDGTTDVAVALQYVFDSLHDGDTLEFTPGVSYKVDAQTIEVRNLRDVTVEGNGARFYLTDARAGSVFSLDRLERCTFRNLKVYGAYQQTFNGSTWTNVAGTPTISGTTKLLDAKDECIRINSGCQMHRDKDGYTQVDVTLSDTNGVANDCIVELVSETMPTVAPTVTAVGNSTGPIAAGTHYYRYAFQNAEGRMSSLSLPTAITLANSDAVDLVIPTDGTTPKVPTIRRYVYRTQADAVDDPRAYYLVDNLNDNVTTALEDNHTDVSGSGPTGTQTLVNLGAGLVEAGDWSYATTFVRSGVETEGGRSASITLAGPSQVQVSFQTGVANVTAMKVYRASGLDESYGSMQYVGEVAGNATATFTDNVPTASLGRFMPQSLTQQGATAGNQVIKTYTLTGTPTVYSIRERLSNDLLKSAMHVRVRKATATANTITVTSGKTYHRTGYDSAHEGNSAFIIDSWCTDLLLDGCWGEGISGDMFTGQGPRTQRVTLHNCVSWGCRRQGIAVVDGCDYTIEDMVIACPGRSGVDIEPWADQQVRRARFSNVQIHDQGNYAFAMNGWLNNFGIVIENCACYGGIANTDGFAYGGAHGLVMRNIRAPYQGATIFARDAVIENIHCKAIYVTSKTNVYRGVTHSTGNVRVNNLHFTGTAGQPFTLAATAEAGTKLGAMTDDALGTILPATPLKLKAGTISDADWDFTPPNGTMGLDTTNHRLYIRDGGTWKYATLT
jgi:hypothetical protein